MAKLNSQTKTHHIGTSQKGLCADWQHAARLFIDGNQRLSPRSRYNFFVKFNMINSHMLSSYFDNIDLAEVGMLVKSVNLPGFSFESITKNQYNRKKIAYKNVKYEPVTITMHDDSDGITNALWSIYFDYYCADMGNPSVAYQQNWYRPINTPLDGFRYGLDADISTPIFKDIEIYTMSRGKFLGYTLVNPRITNWKHGDTDYGSNEMMESKMTIEYESVAYTGGSVYDLMDSSYFGTLHYDTEDSPLADISSTQVDNPGGLEEMFAGIVNGLIGNAVSTIAGSVINNIAAPIVSGVLNTRVSTVNLIGGTVFPQSNTTYPTQYISQATQTNLLGSDNAQ